MQGIVIDNMKFRRIITALFLSVVLGIMLGINAFADDEDFIPRTTAPAFDDSIYSANFFALYVTSMPNCTTYAYGRAWEILGHEPDLCHGSSVHWFPNDGVSSNPNDCYERGDEPQLGAIACWDLGSYGHVAVVESIDGDTVTISESDSVRQIYWHTRTCNINDMGSGFQGYIYLLEKPPEPVFAEVTTAAVLPVETTSITTTVVTTTVTAVAAETTAATIEITESTNTESENIDPMPVVRVMFLIIIAAVVVVRGVPAIIKCCLPGSRRSEYDE